MQNAFALVHTWPELRNAEYEVLQRILAAGKNAGYLAVVVDNNGKILWSPPEKTARIGSTLCADEVDFLISLHFESPRLLDIYSYYAVWQPLDFYYDFGYQQSIDKFSSHNDLISCDSDVSDAHAINLFTGLGRPPEEPLPRMFHMVPEPYLTPNISDASKLFYIGINWERLGRPKGRFHEALTNLDNKGLTAIYGPENIHGVAPWEGFKTYEGELPFDGQSVLRAINRAGICLALSSASHKRAGIMSNRLFEGLAGGAAVIATPNPIIDKHFSDVVYLVDDSRGEAVLGQMILEALHQIRADTLEATRRVLEGQRILREHCSLEASLRALFHNHDRRRAHFEATFLKSSEVTVLLIDDHGSCDLLSLRLKELRAQKLCCIDLHVVCDRAIAASIETESLSGAIRSITVHRVDFIPESDNFDGLRPPPQRSGPAVGRALKNMTTPFFAFLSTNEVLFSDHFASLVKALTGHTGAQLACSGALRQTRENGGILTRSLLEMRWANDNGILLVNGPSQRGRFIFRAALANAPLQALMNLLDGEEARYFQLAGFLAGPLAQSNYASYLVDESITQLPRISPEQIEHQQQFIRDVFTRDPRWLDRLSRGVKIPEFVYAYAPGTPVRWSEFRAPPASRESIPVGRLLALTEKGPGLPYITHGFSWPETAFTWICSDRGIIDFRMPDHAAEKTHNFELVFVVLGRRSIMTGREQHCLVLFNGMSCAYLEIPEERTEIRVRIPRDLISPSSNCRVELIPDHLEPVNSTDGSKIDGSKDDRLLSMALYSFGIMPVMTKIVQVLRPNIMYGCGLQSIGAGTLARSFYPSEPDLTWLAGLSGEIRFRIFSHVRRPLLKLRLWGRRSAAGARQHVALSANGNNLGSFELDDGFQLLNLALPPMELEEVTYSISVILSHAEGVSDANGRIIDGRLLGLAVGEIGIFEENEASPDNDGDSYNVDLFSKA